MGVLFPELSPARIWPEPPDQPRIKLIGAIRGSDDLKAATSGGEAMARALRGARPEIQFSGPQTIAIHGKNLLAVADPSGTAVHILHLDDRTHVRISGWGDERFGAPMGVAWVDARLFVTDAQRGEIVVLDASGTYVRNFGKEVLHRPVGIAYVPSRQQLYVIDGDDHQIRVFNMNGAIVASYGHRGSSPGEFNYPSHICAEGDRLLVADSGNFRVQLLDLNGQCLKCFGQKGDAAGDFSLPKGVAFDSEGHIYVVDAQFENVQIFDPSGQLLMAFGEEGEALGDFSLPAGIVIDELDRIWVADSGNKRIQVFSYLRTSS
ncbi:MAG: hypothetical protein HY287_01455 [Planctomycetes bacterium]|nr:hypothetical protein [Planctomycetota bacterium]MBI3832974.1 hypothetical protein [Planctomycetota bacterium]